MYTVNARIRGTASLLQHAYPATQLAPSEVSKRQTGGTDYSLEWLDTMYQTESGLLYQPATHLEGSMVKAAASFKIKGGRGKTWKDAIKAYVYVTPDEIPHLRDGTTVQAPDASLIEQPTDHLKVNVSRVVVQRAAVARSRLQILPGWELAFTIEVADEQVTLDALRQILDEAGRAVGIGDYRPRYGRFEVIEFRVNNA